MDFWPVLIVIAVGLLLALIVVGAGCPPAGNASAARRFASGPGGTGGPTWNDRRPAGAHGCRAATAGSCH